MSKNEAAKVLIKVKQDALTGALRYFKPLDGEELLSDDFYDAVDMAIRSLEREQDINRILDRIKAEIRELATADTVDTLVDVVRIMNKYRGGEE